MKNYSLCFDLGSPESTLCLFEEGEQRVCNEISLGFQKQSEKLIGSLQALLQQQSIGIKDISQFIFGIGPGSFTGLRVGLSTVKAFALNLDKPIVTLENHEVRALEFLKSTAYAKINVLTRGSSQWFSFSQFQNVEGRLKLIAEKAIERGEVVPSDECSLLDQKVEFSSPHEIFPLRASYLGKNRKQANRVATFRTLEEICNLSPKYGIPCRFD